MKMDDMAVPKECSQIIWIAPWWLSAEQVIDCTSSMLADGTWTNVWFGHRLRWKHRSSFFSLVCGVSAVGHLVEGGERRQDPALVGLHDVSVLDHLVQDDVDSVQVEHDLVTSQGNKTK